MNENPLSQYFRTPAIHLELPSQGKHYPEGVLEMPESGEVPVMPMTAVDEITYKTPDALFNGSAVVDVIQSCVPAIKDAWQMPITDLTAVLCAIRIASFGHEMDIETKCPKCNTITDYTIDLRTILDGIEVPDYEAPITVSDLVIMFKPMSYKDFNENNKLQFEEQKVNQIMANSEISDEDQIRLLSETFKKISKYTISTIAKNIASIRTPDSTVTNEEHILDFLRQCESTVYKKIKNAVIAQKTKETLKPLHIKCHADVKDEKENTHECGHEYDQNFTLDMSSFFDQSS